MPGRSFQGSDGYRYGFNGMEKDDEVKGAANSLDFGARIYDSRIGRWASTDPLQALYSDLSPYNFVGNTPILFIDPDGKKFVNPYKSDYDDAKQKLEDAQSQYDKLVETYMANNNGEKPGRRERREFRKQSGIKDKEDNFESASVLYEEVENYLYTLKVTNKKEYDYFENLTDADGNEITITIFLKDEAESVGGTEGWQIITNGVNKGRATALKGITITLYTRSLKAGPNANLGFHSGRNYRTFTNELGDVQFFFRKVVDDESYKFWYETANDNFGRYDEPEGAGEYSNDYSDDRVAEVKQYAKDELKDDESFNAVTNTIGKKEK